MRVLRVVINIITRGMICIETYIMYMACSCLLTGMRWNDLLAYAGFSAYLIVGMGIIISLGIVYAIDRLLIKYQKADVFFSLTEWLIDKLS